MTLTGNDLKCVFGASMIPSHFSRKPSKVTAIPPRTTSRSGKSLRTKVGVVVPGIIRSSILKTSKLPRSLLSVLFFDSNVYLSDALCRNFSL